MLDLLNQLDMLRKRWERQKGDFNNWLIVNYNLGAKDNLNTNNILYVLIALKNSRSS